MFYQRLRDLKEDKDLKQSNIAKIIKVSENQYGRYERGENDIPLEKALILADFYNVSLDYIAGRTNDKKGFNKSDLPNSEIELLKKYRSLSKERQVRVLERIDMLAEDQEEENAKIKGGNIMRKKNLKE